MKKLISIIVLVFISSCHEQEDAPPEYALLTQHIILLDSAHEFYPYVDSSLPFVIPKYRATITGIEIRTFPGFFPQFYRVLLKGKILSPRFGDSLTMWIDSATTNWPHPPRMPKAYHF